MIAHYRYEKLRSASTGTMRATTSPFYKALLIEVRQTLKRFTVNFRRKTSVRCFHLNGLFCVV